MLKPLSFILTAVILVGCGGKTSGPVSGTPAPTGGPAGPTNPANPQPQSPTGGGRGGEMGGADSTGGGNGLELGPEKPGGGKRYAILEDFCKDGIQKRPEFKEFIEPIIANIVKVHAPLASDLMHIVNERHWCIGPVSLDTLPGYKVGVEFETVQLARHGAREIWIDSRKLDAMENDSRRGMTLLHEIVMGVAFMRFQNDLDKCLAEIAIMNVSPEAREHYGESRDACHKRYAQAASSLAGFGRKPIKPTPEMIASIRELTIMLWTRSAILSPVELSTWIKVNDFRSYPEAEKSEDRKP